MNVHQKVAEVGDVLLQGAYILSTQASTSPSRLCPVFSLLAPTSALTSDNDTLDDVGIRGRIDCKIEK